MFSKKSAEPQSPVNPVNNPGRNMASKSGSTFSVFGSDIIVTGDIQASADLHIDGSVDGDITCASLVQGETSAITGAIKAESARLSGTVHGSITARELVILRTAKITGDVFYDTLTIEQGAQVEGCFAHRDTNLAEPAPIAAKPELAVAG